MRSSSSRAGVSPTGGGASFDAAAGGPAAGGVPGRCTRIVSCPGRAVGASCAAGRAPLGAGAAPAEELDEIAEARPEELEEEVGDLLFAVVNFARFLKVEPEEALRRANRKFEARFRQIEQVPGFAKMSLEEMEELWVAAKKAPADA